MNPKILQKKKAELETEFNKLKSQGAMIEKAIAQAQTKYQEIVDKMNALTGAWKTVDELLKGKGKKK